MWRNCVKIKAQCGERTTPLQLVSHWKCDERRTDFRLDYNYNTAALRTRLPLHNVSVLLPVSGRVTNMQAQPHATWCVPMTCALISRRHKQSPDVAKDLNGFNMFGDLSLLEERVLTIPVFGFQVS